MKTTLLSCMLTILIGHLTAQTVPPDSLFRFYGYIMDPADDKGLPNVHILNLSKGTGTVSAIDGSFELHVRDTDSLKISCIGYCDRYFLVSRSIVREQVKIFLQKDTVLMDEILIHSLGPRRFFKYTFLELKLPEKEEMRMNPAAFQFKEGEGPIPPTGIIFKGPVQLLYDAFNKKARLQRKLKRTRAKYFKYIEPVIGEGDSI